MKGQNGKGDSYRPYDPIKYGDEFDRIFGKKENDDNKKEDINKPTEE